MRIVSRFMLLLMPLALSIFALSCKGDGDPDVSGIKISLRSFRLDRDLAAIDTNHIPAALQSLKNKYPDFLDFYLDTLMAFGVNGNYSDDTRGIREGLHSMLTHPDYRGLFDTVAKHFPDTKIIDADLVKGFQYLKHYQPAFHEPKIIYFVSLLNNYSAITLDTGIVGVGLDMYLGAAYPFYRSINQPEYLIRKFTPAHAAPNVFAALYQAQHPFIQQDRTLLDMMIQKGKEQYFLKKILPFVDDSARLGFSAAQTEWCRKNESMIYSFFAQQNLLYEKTWMKTLPYITDGPAPGGMPAESPGGVGIFTGLQIVNAYMKEHPKTSWDQLFAPTDPQVFLQESGYKP